MSVHCLLHVYEGNVKDRGEKVKIKTTHYYHDGEKQSSTAISCKPAATNTLLKPPQDSKRIDYSTLKLCNFRRSPSHARQRSEVGTNWYWCRIAITNFRSGNYPSLNLTPNETNYLFTHFKKTPAVLEGIFLVVHSIVTYCH